MHCKINNLKGIIRGIFVRQRSKRRRLKTYSKYRKGRKESCDLHLRKDLGILDGYLENCDPPMDPLETTLAFQSDHHEC